MQVTFFFLMSIYTSLAQALPRALADLLSLSVSQHGERSETVSIYMSFPPNGSLLATPPKVCQAARVTSGARLQYYHKCYTVMTCLLM